MNTNRGIGVAFRHAQNAGFKDQDGGNELGNFYKYRQKFDNTYFLPIPQEREQEIYVTMHETSLY